MVRIRHNIIFLLTAIIAITVTCPAQADITIRFSSPGYGYNYGDNGWRYNYNPGLRYYYSGPSVRWSDYSYTYRNPYQYQGNHFNKHLPSTHVYGYYPFDYRNDFRYQPYSSRFDRYGDVYNRGYNRGFTDGSHTRYRYQGGRIGIKKGKN
ncbi:MAG: hypothetical protein A2W28_04545 [Gammaproteobacteria bacterium RBG_16_51_14]|nr:MAG: hypothetical protein A2W28_04545 [Gammaproteobacteria bacterium RBG_16_51_14]